MISNISLSFRMIIRQAQAVSTVKRYTVDTSMFGPPMKQKKDNDIILIEPTKPDDSNVNHNPDDVLSDDTNFDKMNKIVD